MVKSNKGQLGFTSLLVMAFIIVIVGASLLPTLAQNTGTAQATEGISGTPSSTLLGLNTLMYALLIMGSVAVVVFVGLRYLGMA